MHTRDTRSLAALHDLDVTVRDARLACVRSSPKTFPSASSLNPKSPSPYYFTGRHLARRSPAKLGVAAFHVRFLPLGDAASTPIIRKDDLGALVPSSTSCSAHVVSHHFDDLLRSNFAGLLRPATGHEVRYVSQFPRRSDKSVGLRSCSSYRNYGPFKEYHSSTAVSCHHDRCLLGVLSWLSRHSACSRQASPTLHRSSCVRPEGRTVTLVTRLGLPHTPAGALTIPP
jgi:hypothetical protein